MSDHVITTPRTHVDRATTDGSTVDHERRLRTVLRLNASSSMAAGVLLAAVPDRIDELLDTGHPGWVRLVGLGLLPFAALCLWVARSSARVLRSTTPWIVTGDVAWVVVSVATVLAGWYSTAGSVAVLAMAAAVDLFALLQWMSWRKLEPTR